MPGAIIAIDQARPGPSTSFGAPGVARNDLWEGRVITVRSTQGGNGKFSWSILAAPPGSAATLSGADTATATFTPDLPGSYRVQLVTNGGGSGNVQVLIAAVRYDTNGVLVNYGWRVPAFGEVPAEDNFLGQTLGWSEAMHYIFSDLILRAGGASVLSSLKTITANESPYAALPTDVALAVDTSLGPVDITLLEAVDGRLLAIWDMQGSAGTNAITVNAALLQTIAGSPTLSIADNYGGVLLAGRATNVALGSWGLVGLYSSKIGGPVNLASETAVTGKLPRAHQADQLLGGVLAGFTGTADFESGGLGALAKRSVGLWIPTGASGTTLTTAAQSLGIQVGLWSGVNSGLGRAVATTNRATRMRRVNMKAASTAAGQFAGGRSPLSDKPYTAGTGTPGDGSGFYCVHRWVEADPAPVAGRRSFIGFCDGGSFADANVDPDTLLNHIGIGQKAGDATQFYWIQAGSVAQAAAPIGVAFPPGGNSVNAYELSIWAPNGTADTYYLQLTNLITGDVATRTMTGTSVEVPTSTTLMNFNAWACNNTTALEICLDWASLYIEMEP